MAPSPVRVLVVCTGNICRSPMGHSLLLEELEGDPRFEIDSAGVSAEERGNPVDSRANAALRRGGRNAMRHTARRVSPQDMANSHLILGMTSNHVRTLRRWAEEYGTDPSVIRMWREFDPAAPRLADGARESDLDVDDPWYGDAAGFDLTLTELEAGLPGIIEHIEELAASRGI
ncbi:MAG TPA: low molecular weight phosphotyrosine protein phosphatase [Actinomycetales bacterium]|nr:low molecular weight phosphotyrosine protein phosphatase [Actinomycetales bacterium]